MIGLRSEQAGRVILQHVPADPEIRVVIVFDGLKYIPGFVFGEVRAGMRKRIRPERKARFDQGGAVSRGNRRLHKRSAEADGFSVADLETVGEHPLRGTIPLMSY